MCTKIKDSNFKSNTNLDSRFNNKNEGIFNFLEQPIIINLCISCGRSLYNKVRLGNDISSGNSLNICCFLLFLVEWFTRFKNGDGVNFRERSRKLEREAGKRDKERVVVVMI